MRRLLASLILVAAATAGFAQQPVAPQSIPHPTALFLAGLSDGGTKRVNFRAAAIGTRFFFEEPAGVSVYFYDGTGYRREAFFRAQTLERVLRRYR